MYIYYPSCNFSAASPATAKKVKAYFEKQMPVAGCCRVDKREISPADIALYICQACRETLEDKVKTPFTRRYRTPAHPFACTEKPFGPTVKA